MDAFNLKVMLVNGIQDVDIPDVLRDLATEIENSEEGIEAGAGVVTNDEGVAVGSWGIC